MDGLEVAVLSKRQEVKMLRFLLGVTKMNRIRSGYIRRTPQGERLGDNVREERLRWFGHAQRRDSGYIDAEYRAGRQEEKRKTRKEIRGCREGGHVEVVV